MLPPAGADRVGWEGLGGVGQRCAHRARRIGAARGARAGAGAAGGGRWAVDTGTPSSCVESLCLGLALAWLKLWGAQMSTTPVRLRPRSPACARVPTHRSERRSTANGCRGASMALRLAPTRALDEYYTHILLSHSQFQRCAPALENPLSASCLLLTLAGYVVGAKGHALRADVHRWGVVAMQNLACEH